MPLVLSGVALAGCTGGTNTFFVDSNEAPYTPQDWSKVQSHYKAQLHGRWGTVWTETAHDPGGVFIGSAALLSSTGGNPVRALIRSFGKIKTAGSITLTHNAAFSVFTVSGIGLVSGRPAAGSLCLRFSGHSVAGHSDQLYLGTFQVVGGTGPAGRFHGSGTFLALQPNVLKSYSRPFSLDADISFKRASIGRQQSLSAACRNATKPKKPNPPPKSLKATFAGWAFAAGGASTHSLPSGTTIYPDGATITGAVGCGARDNLYWVIDYTGPSNATLSAYVFKGFQQSLKPGRNVVFLGSMPPNGAVTGKAEVDSRGHSPVTFTPSLALSRSC